MALIGSIAISMQANTAPLGRGLSKSAAMVKGWSSSARGDFSSGAAAIKAGLSKAGDAAGSIGELVRDAFKNARTSDLAKLVKTWGSFLVSEGTAPIRESFASVFGGAISAAGRAVGPRLAGLVGPTRAAFGSFASATSGALGDTYGRAFKAIGRGAASFGPLAIQMGRLGAGAGVAARGFGSVALGLGKVGWGVASAGATALGSSIASVGRSALSVGAGLAKFGALGGAALLALGVKAGASAAHLTEAVNKTEQVFGSSADSVVANANRMSDAYGTAKQDYLDGTAALGGQLQGVGYAEKDAAGLSVQLANLAADAAAFRDVGFEESLTKIRAGLSGESEPLKAWGIMIDENAVKTKALAMGLVTANGEMSNSAKVQARLALIQQGLSKDSGALSRESTGTAAQIGEFWGRLSGLMETIGQTTAPLLGAALQGINTAIVAAGIAWEDGSSAVMRWFGVTSGSLEGAAGGVGILQTAVGYLADGWDLARGGVATFFSYFESGLSTVSGWLASILDGLAKIGAGDWAASARDALQGYSDSAKTLSEDLAGTAAAAFERTSSQTVNDYWAQARAKIDAARQELATSKAEEVGKPKAEEAAPKKTSRAAEFAAASRMGSKEAESILLRSRYGSRKDATAEATKQVVQNTKEITPAIRDLASAVRDGFARPPVFSS